MSQEVLMLILGLKISWVERSFLAERRAGIKRKA